MRTYKALLTTAASWMLARQLLLTTTDIGLSKEDVRKTILRTQILGLSAAAVADVAARAYQGWKHLMDVDVETTLVPQMHCTLKACSSGPLRPRRN